MATRGRDKARLSSEYSWILESADVAVQGEQAGLDTATGTVRPMGKSATQIFVGYFAESKTGDGSAKVRVAIDPEVVAEWLDNDSNPNDVSAASIGSECYAKDGSTVTTNSSGNSVAGRVLDYDADADKVLVQQGLAVTGPTGSSGSALAAGGVADRTALAAIAAASRYNGEVVIVRDDNSLWRFDSASSVTGDEAQELVIAPAAGSGRWIRADKSFIAKVPIDFNNTDGEAIWTVPTGFALRIIGMPFWDVTTGFTGGASSAIGISTSIAGYDTKGDILGGASGDVAATLVAGVIAGTLGGEFDDHVGLLALAMVAADEFQFDRITSAFTAGAGFFCVPVAVHIPA